MITRQINEHDYVIPQMACKRGSAFKSNALKLTPALVEETFKSASIILRTKSISSSLMVCPRFDKGVQ
jgi:hypothetical protein